MSDYNKIKDSVIEKVVSGVEIYLKAHAADSFDKGYDLGKSESDKRYNEGYREGVETARSAILKLFSESKKTDNNLAKMFGYNTVSMIIDNFSITEIAEKFDEFTKKNIIEDTSIHVGDEVRYMKELVIVTAIQSRPNGILISGICKSDGSAMTLPYTGMTKTGNHYNEIGNFIGGDKK